MPKNLKSPLKLIDIQLLDSSFDFIPPKKSKLNMDRIELFEKYSIDIKFDVQEKDKNTIIFFVTCLVNWEEKPEIGYKINTTMVNVFDFSSLKKEMEESELKKNILFSGLGISINNIRNHIVQLTILAPFKEFLLPALDIKRVIERNQEEEI